MKFKILFVLFIWCYFTAESLKGQDISSLNFPYKVGYSLSLKGTAITYKSDGSKQTDSSFTYYNIDKESDFKGKHWVNFHLKLISDSVRILNSPLSINENGMFYNSPGKNKIKKKYIVHAISLPLTSGKTWNTILEGCKATCSVISLNTFVTAPEGNIDAFCIQTIAFIEKHKDYDLKLKMLEFYNQRIGKVAYSSYYFYETHDGKVINLYEVNEVVSDYSFTKN